jgi:CheY-like chemotaxis protein
LEDTVETILVADDDESIRELYYDELTEEWYRVLTAGNGLQALGVLEDDRVDLLLTDVKMPNMDANELLPRSRNFTPISPSS